MTLFSGLFLIYLIVLAAVGRIPASALALLAAINLITFALYVADKQAARTGTGRIAESVLHLVALLGGWPLAWAAQQIVRHKTAKRSFQIRFTVCAIVNALLFILIASS